MSTSTMDHAVANDRPHKEHLTLLQPLTLSQPFLECLVRSLSLLYVTPHAHEYLFDGDVLHVSSSAPESRTSMLGDEGS